MNTTKIHPIQIEVDDTWYDIMAIPQEWGMTIEIVNMREHSVEGKYDPIVKETINKVLSDKAVEELGKELLEAALHKSN